MLLIFDLDDTLIQTSKAITPWRFKKVFEEVLKDDVDPLYLENLLSIHQNYESSEMALRTFLENLKVDEALIQQSIHKMAEYDTDIPVELFDGVYETLSFLKNKATLCLVTAGGFDIQTLKIEKSGLKSFFNKIEIATSKDKSEIYKNLLQDFSSNKVFVIGDRVVKDLLPAKMLGFSTVLVRQGRGLYQKFQPNIVDYVIDDVIELQDLLKLQANT